MGDGIFSLVGQKDSVKDLYSMFANSFHDNEYPIRNAHDASRADAKAKDAVINGITEKISRDGNWTATYSKVVSYRGRDYRIEVTNTTSRYSSKSPYYDVAIYNKGSNELVAQFDDNWKLIRPDASEKGVADRVVLGGLVISASCANRETKHYKWTEGADYATRFLSADIPICVENETK